MTIRRVLNSIVAELMKLGSGRCQSSVESLILLQPTLRALLVYSDCS